MARYILIESNSGYIWGDSADLNGKSFDGTPCEFAAALDTSLGTPGRQYELIGRNPRTTDGGYDVYRADVRGSEAVPVVQDVQDQDTIESVMHDCEYVGFITITDADQ